MTEDTLSLGRIRRLDDGFEGRLERRLPHPPETVWRLLTEE